MHMDSYDLLQNGTSAQPGEYWALTSMKTAVDAMPPIRVLVNYLLSAFAFAESALGLTSPVHRFSGNGSASAVCNDPQLSCHNTTAVDNLCCFNSPGGSLLQTQFWDTDPATGPADSWTIHGLWPDNCDGTYQQFCDDARAYTNISAIIEAADPSLLHYMQKYWTSNTGSAESFWEHEWGKHGTCISTLDPDCYTDYQPTEEVPDYFQRTVSLFKTLPSYQWLSDAGITPSSSKTYSADDIQAALSKNHDGKKVYIGCTDNGELDEIWYFYNVRGSLQTGDFVPDDSLTDSTCTGSSIKYLSKSGGSGGNSTSSSLPGGPSSTVTSSSSGPSSTPTGAPFSGKGYLNVTTSGSKKGCIISGGTWYTTGTCAGFTATSSGDGFTLKSSKGDCAVSAGKLTCGSGVSSASTFSSNGSSLAYSGKSTFYADAVPSGSTQGTVYTDNDGHGVSLTIEWHSI